MPVNKQYETPFECKLCNKTKPRSTGQLAYLQGSNLSASNVTAQNIPSNHASQLWSKDVTNITLVKCDFQVLVVLGATLYDRSKCCQAILILV